MKPQYLNIKIADWRIGSATLSNPCIPFVYGCTDINAVNYNPAANKDDGSCFFPIFGCTNPDSYIYNPDANVDDGSCCFVAGCTASDAFNYNPNACYYDDSCIPKIYGCMTLSAYNYDPYANTDNGSCCFIAGCTDPEAFNYNPNACYDDYSCIGKIYGCTDPDAYNYDPNANIDDGSCCYIAGCTDPDAFNYNPDACYDDGSCTAKVYGCTDQNAYNYDPYANINQGCLYCPLQGLSVNVRYSNSAGPCPGGHRCNAAQFYLLVNGINIGLVDLNNGSDGGDRNTVLYITSDYIADIIANTTNAAYLNINLSCATPPNEDRGWGLGGCHSSVPWVVVVDGLGRELYNACPSTNVFSVPLICT